MVIEAGRGGLGQPPRPTQTPQQQRAEMLNRQLRRVNGIDITAQTQAAGINGYQDALPDLELSATWQSATQQGYALRIRGQRAGLNLQRDVVQAAHHRQAESTMVVHFRDEGIRAFATELQHDVPAVPYTVLAAALRGFMHATLQGRKVMTRQGGDPGDAPGTLSLFVETSVSDPTIIRRTLTTGGAGGALAMGVIKYNGQEVLVVSASNGSSFNYFLVSNLTNPNSGVVIIPILLDETTFGGPPGSYGTRVPGAFIQSGLPGNPLIEKSLNTVFIQPIESSSSFPGLTWAPATVVGGNTVGGTNAPLALMAVSGRKPTAFFLAAYNTATWQLDAVDALGQTLTTITLSINPLWGAAAIPARGVIALNGGGRVVLWDGREKETGIFADERPPGGQVLFCTGLYTDNGQLYAEVNEVPGPNPAIVYPDLGASLGRGRCRAQKRRYDFELQRWHAISDWTTYTEDGLIRWDYYPGVPAPVVDPGDLSYGFTSSYGFPDLPFGTATRFMHNYVLSALLGTTPSPDTIATWTRKFEPLPGINPYAYNGEKTFAPEAKGRSPGLIFAGRLMLADKYLDMVEWGGIDSGGPGSQTAVRWGEFGHLDDDDDPGGTIVKEAVFKNGLKHADRQFPINSNRSSVLFPQYEIVATEGDDPTLTQQVYPVTFYFHCDIAQLDEAEPSEFGRSDG